MAFFSDFLAGLPRSLGFLLSLTHYNCNVFIYLVEFFPTSIPLSKDKEVFSIIFIPTESHSAQQMLSKYPWQPINHLFSNQ